MAAARASKRASGGAQHRGWYEQVCAPQLEAARQMVKTAQESLSGRLDQHEVKSAAEMAENRALIQGLKDELHDGWGGIIKGATEELRGEFKESIAAVMKYAAKIDGRLWAFLTVSGLSVVGIVVVLIVELVKK